MNVLAPSETAIFLCASPKMSFWKTVYKQYRNFGKQEFRLPYIGTPTLSLTTTSEFEFKIDRYAQLLTNATLSVTLPDIYSPIYPPQSITLPDGTTGTTTWAPYEFAWIEYIGALIIDRVECYFDGQLIQRYSGQYILAKAQRDFSATQLAKFYDGIGHVPELYSPDCAGARANTYPNAFYTESFAGAQPSIGSRILTIPLGLWFSESLSKALPLTSLQYNNVYIKVYLRPINQWFTIRDVNDWANNYPRVAPNFNQANMQMARFLVTPPDVSIGPTSYPTYLPQIWNPAIGLDCTFVFLANEEIEAFSAMPQQYIMKTVHEYTFNNVVGTNKVKLDSLGLVSNWMFFFRRSDANLRNQWTNYTNWPYNYMPYDIIPANTAGAFPNPATGGTTTIGPGVNPNGETTGLYITGIRNPQNIKDILIAMGIILDGSYRENILPYYAYSFINPYWGSNGFGEQGMYYYNFSLNSGDPDQPSGYMDLTNYTNIELEFNTILPPANPYAQSYNICDPNTGDIVAINKPTWNIYEYQFDLYVMEERLNFVEIQNGCGGLKYVY